MHVEFVFFHNARTGWRWVRQDATRKIIEESDRLFPTAEACKEDAKAHGYGAPARAAAPNEDAGAKPSDPVPAAGAPG